MKLWIILVLLVAIDSLLNDVRAYETPTHSFISDQALDRSILVNSPDFLSEVGVTGSVENAGFPSEVPLDEENPFPDQTIFLLDAPIRRIITGGAVLEDKSLRSLYHFHDAVYGGRGLTIGHPAFAYSFTASPDWILNPEGNGHMLVGRFQDFSFADSSRYFYQAITDPLPAFRDVNYGLMFRGLGHIIHHLQDMAQPQHVRNDQHCEKASSMFCTAADNPSYFEKYTDTERRMILAGGVPYNIPVYVRARDFWTNAEHTGIAEFTQSNFISQGTNFELDSLGGLSTNRHYPLPLPLQDSTTLSFDLLSLLQGVNTASDEIWDIMQVLNCNLPLVCEMDFIASNVINYGAGVLISVNSRASSISMLDDELRRRNLRKGITPTYNRLNFHAAYPYLMPRAIAYSAGLINHFFRARLKIDDSYTDDDGKAVIRVQNISLPENSLHSGHFELYYDASDGQRKPVTGLHIRNGAIPLVTGNTLELNAEIPDDIDPSLDKPYMLVFNALDGKIGAEPGVAAIQFNLDLSGVVDRLSTGLVGCPERVYGVRIRFSAQPMNNGQVLLQGENSGATFDFTSVPEGAGIIRSDALWSHRPVEQAEGYQYEVTYRYPGTTISECSSVALGHWQLDERVRVDQPEN